MTRGHACVGLLVLIACATGHRAQAGVSVMAGVPEGFEQLSAPRPTEVTLSYGGDVLGTYKARSSPGFLQLDEVDDVITAVPHIADPAVIRQQLEQPLPAHADMLCTEKNKTACGVLMPETVGVIFDETRLRAELFINKAYLSVKPHDTSIYLPLPKRELGSVYSFNGAVNGTDADTPNFTITNEAIHSFGEMKIMTQATAANKGLRFDNVSGSIDRNGWNATTGLFRSRATDLIADRDIAGVSVSTSRRTVMDKHKNEGNDIILYLPRRSFVSIYREGRLYSSRAYDAGNQQIDTGDLPEGAYPVTLRIQEADGTTRDEKRFFVKAQELPPPGRPVYYAQAGVIRKPAAADSLVPQLTADPLVRVGTTRRVTNALGVTANIVGVRDRALLETGGFWMMDQARVTATVLGSSRGDRGVHAGYQHLMQRMNVALDAREYWMSDDPMASFDMVGNVTQGTAVVNYIASADVTLGLRGSYSKQQDRPATTSVGPYAEWRIWQKQENMLAMNVNAAQTENGHEGSVFMTFTRRFGTYGMNNTIGMGRGGNSQGGVASARVWHDNQQADNNVIVGGGVTADSKNRIISGDADWRNTFGRVRGNVQEAFGTDGNTFGYGGNFAFNAAQTQGDFKIGGSQNDQSAIMIDTQDDINGDTSTTMRVLINDVPRGSFTIGQKQVIYVSPYHTYRVRIVPEHADFLDVDSSDRKVTVYPGNVVKLSWTVSQFYVVAGRILTENGEPLANATLQDSREQVATSAKGYLQAELPRLKSLHFAVDHQKTCTVNLPDDVRPDKGLLIFKQPLTCFTDAQGQS